MQRKWKKSLWGSAVAGVLGVGIALAVPLSANAATVCCYRYWGVSNPGALAGEFKQSPTVSTIDWSAAWVENTGGVMTVHSRVYWLGGSSLGAGGGGQWVYGDPGGEVSYAYGRCGYYWDIPDPGHYQDMYCDIKYSN